MTLTWIASRAGLALPLIAIGLALANWNAQPDRALAWTAAIVVSVVIVIVQYFSQIAVRRSLGDATLARSFASATSAVTFGALIIVIPLAVTLAQSYGIVKDPDSGRRTTMILIGASLAVMGNALPRMLPPPSSMLGNAARVQAFQRVAGWTWVLFGLGFATAWLALPIPAAGPASVAMGVAALIVTIVQLVRLRKPPQELRA